MLGLGQTVCERLLEQAWGQHLGHRLRDQPQHVAVTAHGAAATEAAGPDEAIGLRLHELRLADVVAHNPHIDWLEVRRQRVVAQCRSCIVLLFNR